MKFRLGTRGSKLALTQSRQVMEKLAAARPGVEIEMVVIKTQGDRVAHLPFDKMEGKGFFVKEIEEALIRREIDLAVHSIKDLPSDLPSGLALGAICERILPNDVLISRAGHPLHLFPRGARVGTSSLRRQSQLLHLRPDLQAAPLRGNLDTRLRKLRRGEFDGIIVAAAGLLRMGWFDDQCYVLPAKDFIPATGQGALGIEVREGDGAVRELVSCMNHEMTAAAIRAERAFLGRLGGGCHVPAAAFAELEDGSLTLSGMVAGVDGGELIRLQVKGLSEKAQSLGEELAERLLSMGAEEILRGLKRG